MPSLATLFHLIAVVHFYFGLYYYLTYVNESDLKNRKYEFAGLLVYLTFLTFVSRFHQFQMINIQGHDKIFRSFKRFTSQSHCLTTLLGLINL